MPLTPRSMFASLLDSLRHLLDEVLKLPTRPSAAPVLVPIPAPVRRPRPERRPIGRW